MNSTIIDRYPESAAKQPVFKSCLEKNVIHNDTESCSEGLLIYSNTAAPYYKTFIHDPFTVSRPYHSNLLQQYASLRSDI
jgi:hypothetical protein